ncbi:MAG TPA: metalloregulator ArsR/SmtB family transcription factor [Armatimonadota bacterium]|nr:metalloregulator ArsR/SmtB family transcription factor [Armatimonadota bacterium]
MPERLLVSKELAALLGVFSHPHRIQIIEELGDRELDVNSLQELLGISHSGVSQHLALLRAHRIVVERREGRHVHYRLRQPGLAAWLLGGIAFIGGSPGDYEEFRSAVERVKGLWPDTHSAT